MIIKYQYKGKTILKVEHTCTPCVGDYIFFKDEDDGESVYKATHITWAYPYGFQPVVMVQMEVYKDA